MNHGGGVRAHLEDLFRAALAAVDASTAVRRAVAREAGRPTICGSPLREGARLVVLAVGKAAGAMARGPRKPHPR